MLLCGVGVGVGCAAAERGWLPDGCSSYSGSSRAARESGQGAGRIGCGSQGRGQAGWGAGVRAGGRQDGVRDRAGQRNAWQQGSSKAEGSRASRTCRCSWLDGKEHPKTLKHPGSPHTRTCCSRLHPAAPPHPLHTHTLPAAAGSAPRCCRAATSAAPPPTASRPGPRCAPPPTPAPGGTAKQPACACACGRPRA